MSLPPVGLTNSLGLPVPVGLTLPLLLLPPFSFLPLPAEAALFEFTEAALTDAKGGYLSPVGLGSYEGNVPVEIDGMLM